MSDFIELKKVIITDKKLLACSSCTTYIEESLPEKIDIKDLMKNFKRLCSDLKKKGAKISYKYRSHKFVEASAAEFDAQYAAYLNEFNKAAELAKKIFVDKPLPVGTSNNPELAEMFKHCHAMNALNRRSAVFSKVYEFKNTLDGITASTEHETNLSGMTVYF